AGEVSCEHLDRRCAAAPCSHPGRASGQCCPSCEVCDFERVLYTDGQTFKPPGHGPCLQCTCTKGNVRCVEETCRPVTCPNSERDPERCCPVCKVCVQDGVEFPYGEEWTPESDPCSTCTCLNGDTVCGVSQCPPVTCLHPTQTEGDCCPVCDTCTYNQRLYSNGQTFNDPDNPCQDCQCEDGTVQCSAIVCPPVLCSRPERTPGQCCTRCPDCRYQDTVYVEGEQFPNPLNQCQECGCHDGEVICKDRGCPGPQCSYPLPGTCCQNNCN
ncbi:kielin/chordin-like protein, partial [Discoglossus pictus]